MHVGVICMLCVYVRVVLYCDCCTQLLLGDGGTLLNHVVRVCCCMVFGMV